MARNKGICRFYQRQTGIAIEYLGMDVMKERYPLDDYPVVGEIDIKEQSGIVKVSQFLEGEEEIYVQPIGTYEGRWYKTIGYVPCGFGEFIEVKEKSKLKMALYILIPMLLLLILLGGFFLHNNGEEIDPNAGDYTAALKRPADIDESRILIPGYGQFELEQGSDTINTVLFNPEGNPCYFKFTLEVKDTNEVLYESKLVPPGKGITPITLSKTFHEIGSYELVLSMQTYDVEDTSIRYNGSTTNVKLNVVEK